LDFHPLPFSKKVSPNKKLLKIARVFELKKNSPSSKKFGYATVRSRFFLLVYTHKILFWGHFGQGNIQTILNGEGFNFFVWMQKWGTVGIFSQKPLANFF